jgi:very-short-patch-repair endonuclease
MLWWMGLRAAARLEFSPPQSVGRGPSPRPSPRKRGEGAGGALWTSNFYDFAWAPSLAGSGLPRSAREGYCFMRGAEVAKTNKARRLRRNATIAEQRLWYRLRSRSLHGMKFVRQEPIGPYIVDFVCRERRLIIEVDGGQHVESERDLVRDQWLRGQRYSVLRFWNNDVIQNTEGVLGAIANALRLHRHAPSPRLRGEGRGEGTPPQGRTGQDAPAPGPGPQARREG